MVKVVGKDESAIKRITCRNCATILEYTPSDVRPLWRGTDIGGGADGGDGFSCPSCSKNVVTKSW